jgi:hypothetical protein
VGKIRMVIGFMIAAAGDFVHSLAGFCYHFLALFGGNRFCGSVYSQDQRMFCYAATSETIVFVPLSGRSRVAKYFAYQ